jgi:peroxiredoxin Q/BCP
MNKNQLAPVRAIQEVRANRKFKGRMKFTHILTAAVLAGALLIARGAATPKVGDKAPEFEAKDQDGKTVKLSDFAGKQSVLLYFYPRDETPGCTKEACGFRDRLDDLKKKGVAVLGVSRDDAESHKKFIAKEKLNFPLLVDTEGKLTETYGAGMEGRLLARRVSFLIGKDGKIVHVTDAPQYDKHLNEMKDAVEKLKG